MGDNELFGKTLPQRGKCEMIEREQAKKRVAQRINLLVTDANPDKDYHTMYMGEIVKVLKRV